MTTDERKFLEESCSVALGLVLAQYLQVYAANAVPDKAAENNLADNTRVAFAGYNVLRGSLGIKGEGT